MTPQARSLLAAARPAFSPSAVELDRLRTRLAPELDSSAEPEATGAGDDGPPSVAEASRTGAANIGLYLVVGAIVLVAVWALVQGLPEPPEAAQVGSVTTDRGPAELAPAERPPEAEPAAPTPERDLPSPTADRAPPPPASPLVNGDAGPSRPAAVTKTRARRERSTTNVSGAPASDDLAAELAVIGRARKALNNEAWPLVRAAAAEHRRRFPSGALREEARVLDLIARCATEPSATVDAEVRSYLEVPGRVFAARLRRACAVESP